MTSPFDGENGDFLVLVNSEAQYSIWPGFREPPNGWSVVGPRGARQTCLDWIEIHWTDMRPASVARAAAVPKH